MKNVLFIGLNYHDYTTAIVKEIETQFGCHVDYVDIQPRSFSWNIIKVIFPRFFRYLLSRYHQYHFKKSSKISYDVVFFLQAHQVSDNNFVLLRTCHPKGKFILYNWDSLKNHNYLSKIDYFHRVVTFDPGDAESNNFEYLPLFCTRNLQSYKQADSTDIFMIGNVVKSARLDAVNEFMKFCRSNGFFFKTHLRVSVYVLFRLLFLKYSVSNLHLRNASSEKIISFYESSSVVFDWANHEQTGLTMRAVEALGTGKKLITNCDYLRNSKYAEMGQVLVVDQDYNFSSVNEFINSDNIYEPITEFYIQNFISRLFGG